MSSFLLDHGLDIAIGITVVLLVGALVASAGRAPIHRFVVAQFTLGCTWVAVALLVVPLPRPARLELNSLAQPTVSESTPPDPDQVALAYHGESALLPFEQVPVEPLPLEWTEVGPSRWGPAASNLSPIRSADPVAGPVEASTPTRIERVDQATARTTAAPVIAPTPGIGIWIVWAFLLGATLFASHLLACAVILARTIRHARRAPRHLVERATRWGASSGTRILVSDAVQRPFCCGVARGVVVLPESLAREEDEALLEAVLRHEVAHLDQDHPRARLIAALSAPLLYWNPLYWWLARELRRSAEILADDTATASIEKRCYVSSLLSLAERSAPSIPAPGMGVLGSRREFLLRMETLLMRNHRLTTSTSSTHLVARCAAGAALLCVVSLGLGNAPLQVGTGDQTTLDSESVQLISTSGDRQNDANREGEPRSELRSQDREGKDPRTESFRASLIPGFSFRQGAAPIRYFHFSPRPLGRTTSIGWTSDAAESRTAYGKGFVCQMVAKDMAALGRFLIAIESEPIVITSLEATGHSGRQCRTVFTLVKGTLEDLVGVTSSLGDVEATACVPRGTIRESNKTVFGRDSFDWPSKPVFDEPDVPDIDGKILTVVNHDGGRIVVINRGRDHGVRKGMTFDVYRASEYKGRIEIDYVTKTVATGHLTVRSNDTTFEAGDSVTTQI